mmetsp:Transcript_33118/g.53197  ORF Transcript_33118/g.53197 Transcript_33118/m.53197 type:complete len:211 (+) Transcript_33118:1377-2009(+)
MLPEHTSPELTPIPILISDFPAFARNSLNLTSSFSISIAARQAFAASNAFVSGTPKTAISASPINLSTIPPCFVITSTMHEKYSLRVLKTSEAPHSSLKVVNPLISANKMLTRCFAPPNSNRPSRSRWSTKSGARYLSKVRLSFCSGVLSSIQSTIPRISLPSARSSWLLLSPNIMSSVSTGWFAFIDIRCRIWISLSMLVPTPNMGLTL